MTFKPAKDIPEFIQNFIIESNAIERIYREPTTQEIDEVERFLNLEKITIEELENFISVYQPTLESGKKNRVRDKKGLDVWIGEEKAPAGSPIIKKRLEDLLEFINVIHFHDAKPGGENWYRENFGNAGDLLPKNPMECHRAFEQLHPFLDGNGRTGRIIWLWQMLRLRKNLAPLGFLQSFYYQTLSDKK